MVKLFASDREVPVWGIFEKNTRTHEYEIWQQETLSRLFISKTVLAYYQKSY